VKYLLLQRSDLLNDNTLLIIAARHGNFELVKYFVVAGLDINVRDGEVLISAIKGGYWGIIKYLIDNGANIHARNDEALLVAVKKGWLETVKYLVFKGVNPKNIRYLRKAAKHGHLRVVKYLVEGEGVKFNGNVLATASKEGQIDIVKYFLEWGEDEYQLELALRNAIKGEKIVLMKFLISKGANPSNPDVLREAINENFFDILKVLVEEYDVDVTIDDNIAIRVATWNGNKTIAKYLIEHGASLEIALKEAKSHPGGYNGIDIIPFLKSLKA
jgi:ankyrin repeat protein